MGGDTDREVSVISLEASLDNVRSSAYNYFNNIIFAFVLFPLGRMADSCQNVRSRQAFF